MNSLSDPETKILTYFGNDPERLVAFREGIAYPISAEVDLTWQCALNCKGCHSKHLHQGMTIEPEQIKRILTQLRQNGLQSVTWAGGGEPFESPHWRYAVNLAHDLGLDQACYSYLPGLDQEMADFLGSRMAFVYTHSCSTRGLTKPKGKTVWTYGWLLDAENWPRIPEMVKKFDSGFFNFLDFRPLCPQNKLDADVLDYSWIPEGLELLDQASAYHSFVKFADYKFTQLLDADGGRNYQSCLSTDLTTIVGPDGTVWECLNRRGYEDSRLGNLLTEDLTDIWARKPRCRTNLVDCRIQCRNNSTNRTLYKIFGSPVQHVNFV